LCDMNIKNYYIKEILLLNINKLNIGKRDLIGLVGRNGSGKTSLLEIIAGKLVPEEGDISHHAHVKLLPQLKRTNTTKSGGEITQEYIQQALSSNAALLLVDEPTTNLDTNHIEWVEKRLQEWQGAYVIVSHDRAFLDALCSTI